MLAGIVDMIRSLWENLSTTLQGIWSGIQTAASRAWELIKNMVLVNHVTILLSGLWKVAFTLKEF